MWVYIHIGCQISGVLLLIISVALGESSQLQRLVCGPQERAATLGGGGKHLPLGGGGGGEASCLLLCQVAAACCHGPDPSAGPC